MRIGTNHFVAFAYAVIYYQKQGIDSGAVQQKYVDGEIKIGPPTLKDGESLVIIDDGCRYAIDVSTQPLEGNM